MLKQIIYFSRDIYGFGEEALLDLMENARKYNRAHGITGTLLYGDAVFIQCLEGDSEEVDELYEKIKNDRRHTDITTLREASVSERSFSGWLMGCVEITGEEALQISTAEWENAQNQNLPETDQSDGFKLMKTLWQIKKHKNLTPPNDYFGLSE